MSDSGNISVGCLEFSYSFGESPPDEDEEKWLDAELNEVIEKLRLSHPDADRLGELNALVEHCKSKLKQSLDDGEIEGKQDYMDRLVKLGLEKQSLEDNGVNSSVIRVRGHEFELQSSRGRHNPCCEVCMHTIWRLVQSWRRCNACGLRSHDKCAAEAHRLCAGVIAAHRDFSLATEIRVERGLSAQCYQCAECDHQLMYDGPAHMEPRLCDYTGMLYCPSCHWGDQWSIPARILQNMDASPRPVCRSAKQLLSIVDSRPLLFVGDSSNTLIKYHKELKRVQELRRNFLFMKCFFISCRVARKLRILQYLNQHQHFVENTTMYSLRELKELCQGSLLQNLEDIHEVFKRHIEEECETCKGKGFYCKLCSVTDTNPEKEEILYPFSDGVAMCHDCMAVYHAKCFERRSHHCTRCELRRKRVPPALQSDTASLYSLVNITPEKM